jgi:hypothetical protein
MTEDQVVDLIRQKVTQAGSMRGLAGEWDVTPSYISDLLNGRRAPGVKILGRLGLTRVKTIDYQEKENNDGQS